MSAEKLKRPNVELQRVVDIFELAPIVDKELLLGAALWFERIKELSPYEDATPIQVLSFVIGYQGTYLNKPWIEEVKNDAKKYLEENNTNIDKELSNRGLLF